MGRHRAKNPRQDRLSVKVTGRDKLEYLMAADAEGLSLSTWVRLTLKATAKEVNGRAGTNEYLLGQGVPQKLLQREPVVAMVEPERPPMIPLEEALLRAVDGEMEKLAKVKTLKA